MLALTKKTYNIAEGLLEFVFNYDPVIASLYNFDVLDISPLKFGFDSGDQKKVSIYPSNIEVVIDDFEGDNYLSFKELYKNYNATYPFNHYSIFYLHIKLNGAVIFNGIIDEVSSDHKSKTLTVAFVDGLNKYKDIEIGNPYVLNKLFELDLIPRTTASNGNAWAYGFSEIQYWSSSIPGTVVNSPGYGIDMISTGDKDTRLQSVILTFIRLLREDLQIEFNNEYKFGELNSPISDMVTIDQVNIRRILSNLIGRYVVIKKTTGYDSEVADLDSVEEYRAKDTFELVFEDAEYKVFAHNWSGHVGQLKFEKGIDEKKISEILKVIALNTFSYFGLKDANQFFFRHKRFNSAATPLAEILSMDKTLTVDRISYLVVNDYYSGNYGSDGNNLNADGKLEYRIPFNSFMTDNGWEYRLNYYYGSQEKRVIYFYDAQLQFRDIPQEVISRAEWELHRNFRDQYEFELSGINYNFDSTYSVDFENYKGIIRPITIELDLLSSKTKMTALEI